MTHVALTNTALFVFLVFMTALLVTFVGAVIAAPPVPPAPAREAPALTVEALARPAPHPPAPPPLPRRRPLATAPAADTASWPAEVDAVRPNGAAMPAYVRVDWLQVSGGPPWGPAPKPPGPDPWAAEDFSPARQPWPGQRSASSNRGQPTSNEPRPGTRAVPDARTRHARHARDR
jgi:hypothetical protein